MMSPWKSIKRALSPKRKEDTQVSRRKEVFQPRNYYYVGPTCITTCCDIFPRRMGVKATAPYHCSGIQEIVRDCAARFLVATGNKVKYMIGYDTVFMSLPSDVLDEFLFYLQDRLRGKVPLTIIADVILMRTVGKYPGVNYKEMEWAYDCTLVRYEDLLILRFRCKKEAQ